MGWLLQNYTCPLAVLGFLFRKRDARKSGTAKQRMPNLFKVLGLSVWKTMLACYLYRFATVAVTFFNPLLLQ